MNVIIISPKDNVAIVLRDIAQGEQLDVAGQLITAAEDIPYTHKIALTDIPAGAAVLKYGEKVAVAGKDIKQGEWVHVHNLLSDGDQ
jgi:altronate hydrolase